MAKGNYAKIRSPRCLITKGRKTAECNDADNGRGETLCGELIRRRRAIERPVAYENIPRLSYFFSLAAAMLREEGTSIPPSSPSVTVANEAILFRSVHVYRAYAFPAVNRFAPAAGQVNAIEAERASNAEKFLVSPFCPLYLPSFREIRVEIVRGRDRGIAIGCLLSRPRNVSIIQLFQLIRRLEYSTSLRVYYLKV